MIIYIAIENGELGHTPDYAAQVLANRYGDCKGSASLIVEMLRSLGIDARRVWIGTKSIPESWEDRPAFSSGNHMIAAVKSDKDFIFIDGTTGPTDFGYLPPSIQGRQALIENGDNYHLWTVPLLPSSTNVDSIISELSLSDKSLIGNVFESLTGAFKSSMLNSLRNTDSKSTDKIFLTSLSFGRKNIKLDSFSVDNLTTNGLPTRLTAKIELPNILTASGDKMYLNTALLYPDVSRMIVDLKDRQYPFDLRFKHQNYYVNEISLPTDISVVSLPDKFAFNNEWISAYICHNAEGNRIKSELIIEIKETLVPIDKLTEFNDDLRKLSQAISQYIVLTSN